MSKQDIEKRISRARQGIKTDPTYLLEMVKAAKAYDHRVNRRKKSQES